MTDDKICLIIPPSPFLLDERVFPSLGILRVASALVAEGEAVDVLDLSGVSNYTDVVSLYRRMNPRIGRFGITATTPQFPSAHRIASTIHTPSSLWRGDAVTTIGGPHPTLVAAAAKGEAKAGRDGRATRSLNALRDTFHTVVAGDGDLVGAVAMFGGGFIDADDPKTPLFMTDAAYESTPLPSRHLIDLDSYHYTIEGHRSTSLIGQLGCPFQCNFCGGRKSPMLRRIRSRSTKSILEEMEMLCVEHGYTGFMFYDDELNVSKSMVELMDGITDLQGRLGKEFRLRGFVKAELFDERQAKSMRRAGFRWILTGFESGSPRILENINKRATRQENSECVRIAKENDLKVKALMSIGHAGESVHTIHETEDWLLEVRPDDFDVTIITTYPGTPYYDDAIETKPGIWTYTAPKSGDTLHAYEVDYSTTADYYKGTPDGGYKAYVYTDSIRSEDLVVMRDIVERNVREELKIPFNPSAAAVNYEHSMGQSLPGTLLRHAQPIEPQKKIVRLTVV